MTALLYLCTKYHKTSVQNTIKTAKSYSPFSAEAHPVLEFFHLFKFTLTTVFPLLNALQRFKSTETESMEEFSEDT